MTIAWRPGPSGLRLAGIILTAALAFLGEGATYSVLGPYVRDRIGGGDEITGLVLGVGTAAALAARVVVAARVDTGGPRRLMALGVVLASAAGPLYLVASSVPLLLVPRVLAGFGVACAFSAGLAWAVAIAPADRRGQVIGLYGLCVWAGLSLGPVLAAGLRSVGGFDAVWALVALAPLPGLAVLRLLGPSPRTRGDGRRGPLVPRAALVPGAALALATVGQAAVLGFTVLTLDERGVHGSAIALAGFAVAAALVRLVGGHLPDRSIRGCILAGAACGAAGMVVLAAATSLPAATLGTGLMGAAWGFLYPALALLVLAGLSAQQRGAGIAAFSASFDIGFAGSSPLLGLVAASFGYGALFLVAAACLVLVVPIAQLARPRQPAA